MCVELFGLVRRGDNESVRKKDLVRDPSIDGNSERMTRGRSSRMNKDISVRIVHAGRQEEVFYTAVPASQVMKKYPGMSIARPDVFKNPHGSLLWPEEQLLPGQKYYIIPSTTVQKLMRKYPAKSKMKVSAEGKEDMSSEKVMDAGGGNNGERPECSAREFLVSNARWSRPSLRKGIREKKPFVPPLPRTRSCKGIGWEPSLPSVEETSP